MNNDIQLILEPFYVPNGEVGICSIPPISLEDLCFSRKIRLPLEHKPEGHSWKKEQKTQYPYCPLFP
jgi:hypothetical protein